MVTKNLKEKLLADVYSNYKETINKNTNRKITLLENKLQAIKILIEKELERVRQGTERKFLTTLLDRINAK